MSDPRLAQWQQRFDRTMASAQAPQRPNETPDQFQQRRIAANEVLRQLQMSKPTGTAPKPKKAAAPAAAEKRPSGGLSGIFSHITEAMRGAN